MKTIALPLLLLAALLLAGCVKISGADSNNLGVQDNNALNADGNAVKALQEAAGGDEREIKTDFPDKLPEEPAGQGEPVEEPEPEPETQPEPEQPPVVETPKEPEPIKASDGACLGPLKTISVDELPESVRLDRIEEKMKSRREIGELNSQYYEDFAELCFLQQEPCTKLIASTECLASKESLFKWADEQLVYRKNLGDRRLYWTAFREYCRIADLSMTTSKKAVPLLYLTDIPGCKEYYDAVGIEPVSV